MTAKNIGYVILPKHWRIALWILCTAFLIFYLTLSYHNRPITDDLFFFNEFRDKGFFGTLSDFKYNIRLSGFWFIYANSFFKIQLEIVNESIFFFQLLLITFLTFSVRFGLKTFLTFHEIEIKKMDGFLISILIISCYFFFTFQLNEVWFWQASSCIHLLPIPFFIIGFSLIYKRRKKPFEPVAISFCFFILGGMSETFVLMAYSFLFTLILLEYLLKFKLRIIALYSKTSIAICSMSILFIFNVFFSGTDDRLLLENSNDFSSDFLLLFSNIIFQNKMILYLSYVTLFFFIGNSLSTELSGEFNHQKIFKSILLLNLIALISTFTPLIYIYGHLGPTRAWTPFGFTLTISTILISFLIGTRTTTSFKWSGILNISIATFLIVIYSVRQFPIVSNYSKAFDTRTETLLDHKNTHNPKAIEVKALPPSGLLIRSSIHNDSTNWSNQRLRQKLDLNFEIYTIK